MERTLIETHNALTFGSSFITHATSMSKERKDRKLELFMIVLSKGYIKR